MKYLEEDIEAVKEKIEDDMICEKIRQFVYAPKEIQDIYRADASTLMDWLFVMEIATILTCAQLLKG